MGQQKTTGELFRYSTDNVFVVILLVYRTYIDGIFYRLWYANGIILSYRISYYFFNNQRTGLFKQMTTLSDSLKKSR